MIKLIKNELKKLLNYFGWKLTKIIKKNYTNQKPNLELLEALHASKGVIHMGGHRGTKRQFMIGYIKKLYGLKQIKNIY